MTRFDWIALAATLAVGAFTTREVWLRWVGW
jgi:hypothetical protein